MADSSASQNSTASDEQEGQNIGTGQLVQLRVPLDQAADAFAHPDNQGRTPIVVMPLTPSRVQRELLLIGVAAVAVGFLVMTFFGLPSLAPWLIIAGLVLIVVAVWQAFWLTVPEGTTALLTKGGRHVGTRNGGRHLMSPWVGVSHLVTRREIPYDAPVFETPTRDNVRASIDTLITFAISEPYRFVYNITADDFDQVLQATCQDALRSMVRQVTLDRVMDVGRTETDALRDALNAMTEHYGVDVTRVVVTAARPPIDFLRSEEARLLSVVQRAEQTERQALEQRRQADAELLARQQVVARIEREGEELRLQIQQAEARLRVVELETDAETQRLERLEEALRSHPLAAAHELDRSRLEVARALAGNARAVVQLGSPDDIARALMVRDVFPAPTSSPLDGTTSSDVSGNGEGR
ncbi:MAG TPA: SPFH domain-containing protein [Chloroflexota bacterium]|nr:SPFH domain-containing protein [Chloroflexota bacterium]